MTTNTLIAPYLARLYACCDAIEWCADKTVTEAWSTCHRADWMLWIAGRVLDRKLVVRATVECARTALVHTTDPRPGECLTVVQRWTEGIATIEEVRTARGAAVADAYDAANATYAAASAVASAVTLVANAFYANAVTHTVAHAFYTANAANAAVASVVYAASAATLAAYAANASAKSLADQADIVRQWITAEMIESALIEGV